jgi:hypothetical protein
LGAPSSAVVCFKCRYSKIYSDEANKLVVFVKKSLDEYQRVIDWCAKLKAAEVRKLFEPVCRLWVPLAPPCWRGVDCGMAFVVLGRSGRDLRALLSLTSSLPLSAHHAALCLVLAQVFRDELAICKEMVALLPKKLDKIAHMQEAFME